MEGGRHRCSRLLSAWRGFVKVCAVLTLVPISAGATSTASGGEPGAVSLRIETGTHIAPIRAISADREGRYAVTASEDKTARVWDVDTGRLLQTFRPPSGTGNEGKLFAVSMSPDGQLFAASGWSAGNDIYLVNRSNGAIVHRIIGLPNVVTALAFSPDGQNLAVGLWGNHGIRLFGSSNGWRSATERAGSSEVGGDVFALVWSPDGKRLATSAADATLRLFSLGRAGLEPLVRSPATGRDVPYGLSFSADGRRLAVGSANTARVLILDGQSLKAITTIEAAPSGAIGGLSSVAWSGDGVRLYAAGTLRDQNGVFPLCVWKGEATCVIEAPLARNSVTALVTLADGRTLFSTAEPTWGLLEKRGEVSRSINPGLHDYRNLRNQFRLSPNGHGVVIGRTTPAAKGTEGVSAFDLGSLAWVKPGPDWHGPTVKSSRTTVRDWFEQGHPSVNGRSLKLDENELALSATVSRKGDRIAIGSNFFVRCYDEAGRELWRTGAPGSTWQVNISADSRWLVAGFSDGTLRWFRLDDGSEQIALLPHPDGKRWVAWSPQGYFATSVGGEDLVGWQVERGKALSADFFPVSRFRAEYFRPDLIGEIALRGSVSAALGALPALVPPGLPEKGISHRLPPSLRIDYPLDGQTAASPARFKVTIQTPGDAPITGFRARVNGLTVPLPALSAMRSTASAVYEFPIPLPPADADVMVFAENRHGVSPAAVIRLLRPTDATELRADPTGRPDSASASPNLPASPREIGDLRPMLYILAVGVSEYADTGIRLEYSAKDATDLAQVLKGQEGPLYRKVEIRLLTDRNARRDDVLDGLEWIRREMTARDVGIVFLAGHGVNDSDGVYYFLPHDTEVKRLKRTGVIFTEIRNTLISLPGKALFFVDTCHSGNVLGTGLRSLPNDTTAIANELASAENGVIVFTATTGRQYAQESDTWGNGAFTKALVEGLRGKADMTGSGRITHKMLDLYLSERVKQLTEGAQSPVTITPSGVPDFPLAVSPQRTLQR